MANVSDLLRYVLPDVPGCPIVMVENAILTAAIEFCDKSLYWTYDHDPITVVANVPEYELSLPDDSQLIQILDTAKLNNKDISQRTRVWLNNNVTNWQTLTQNQPEHFYIQRPWVIRLVGIPMVTSINGLVLEIALKPTPTATTLPDVVFNEWFEAISYGARSKLMEMPGKEWSEPNTALKYGAIFDQRISDASAKQRAGFRRQDRNNKARARFF